MNMWSLCSAVGTRMYSLGLPETLYFWSTVSSSHLSSSYQLLATNFLLFVSMSSNFSDFTSKWDHVLWYLSSYAWVISLGIMFFSSIHIIKNGKISFLLRLYCIPMYVCMHMNIYADIWAYIHIYLYATFSLFIHLLMGI
jgi:hypothetical protein